jgi:hypothetical protein
VGALPFEALVDRAELTVIALPSFRAIAATWFWCAVAIAALASLIGAGFAIIRAVRIGLAAACLGGFGCMGTLSRVTLVNSALVVVFTHGGIGASTTARDRLLAALARTSRLGAWVGILWAFAVGLATIHFVKSVRALASVAGAGLAIRQGELAAIGVCHTRWRAAGILTHLRDVQACGPTTVVRRAGLLVITLGRTGTGTRATASTRGGWRIDALAGTARVGGAGVEVIALTVGGALGALQQLRRLADTLGVLAGIGGARVVVLTLVVLLAAAVALWCWARV